MSLLKFCKALEAKVIGDSRIIIVIMISRRDLVNPLLKFHFKKARSLFHHLRRINFLNVSCSLNWITNHNTKEVVNLDLGIPHHKEVTNLILHEGYEELADGGHPHQST